MREKHYSQLKIYDRLRASEQAGSDVRTHYGFVVAQHQLIGLTLLLVLISFTAYEVA